MKAVQSALTWAVVAGLVLVALPVVAVVRLVDRTPARVRAGRTFRRIGALVPRVNPAWTVAVGGVDPAALRHPYVVVSNHQSLADIPVIARLPWEMKWVTKAEMFRVPVFGWLQRMAEDIPVDRKDAASRATVLARAEGVLRRGCSVMFFAEGTRSKDGRLKTFYDGAFSLAVQAGVPVLPLAIDGTRDAIPKHGWTFGRADVRLAVLPPVPTEGLTEADVPELRDRVRRAILDRVATWRGVDPAEADALPPGPDRSPHPALAPPKNAVLEGGAEIEKGVETPRPAQGG